LAEICYVSCKLSGSVIANFFDGILLEGVHRNRWFQKHLIRFDFAYWKAIHQEV